MIARKKHLEDLMESFQVIKRYLMCLRSAHHTHLITPSQWPVIRIIVEKKETTVKEIAHSLRITSSAATQLVDGLVKEGYVERQESKKDRRFICLTLSKKAKQKMAAMKKQTLNQLSQLFDCLTDEELKQYLTLNQKITQHLNA